MPLPATASLETLPTSALPAPRRFSTEEYVAIARVGGFEGLATELLEGIITDMTPEGLDHAQGVSGALETLLAAYGKNYWVRPPGMVPLPDWSAPEPDISVTRGNRSSHKGGFPTGWLLFVEISHATLKRDRGPKALIYARAKVPNYWVVDVQHRKLFVHTKPARGKYTSIVELGASQSVMPPDLKVAVSVSDLLG